MTVDPAIAKLVPDAQRWRRHLHAHPELSRQEEWTSARLAGELRKAGFTVTEHIGKYSDGRPG